MMEVLKDTPVRTEGVLGCHTPECEWGGGHGSRGPIKAGRELAPS